MHIVSASSPEKRKNNYEKSIKEKNYKKNMLNKEICLKKKKKIKKKT